MRTFFFLSTLVFPLLLHPLDLCWIKESDRRSNDIILEFIILEDLETGINAIKALKSREDTYVADIISSLIISHSHTRYYVEEYMLRLLLTQVFSSKLEISDLAERVNVNQDGFELLIKNLLQFENPQLKGEILRLLPLTEEIYHTQAAAAGRELTNILKNQDGRITSDQLYFFLFFLEAVKVIGNPDLAEPCLSIYELTKDSRIADLAKRVTKHLLGKR